MNGRSGKEGGGEREEESGIKGGVGRREER